MFWPSSDAEIMGVRPSEYFVYDGSISHSERISQIIRWMDYPPEKRPHLITLYFSEIDSKGHRYGPDSEEVISAIEAMDKTIGNLMTELKSRNFYESKK